MLKKIFGGLATATAIVWWVGRGTIESWFFDRIVKVAEPHVTLSMLVEYGPPVAFFLLAAYLLWWAPRHQTAMPASPASSREVEAPPATSQSAFMTLREAAIELYNFTQLHKHEDGDLEFLTGFAEAAVEGREQSPDDILDYMAVFMVQTHHMPVRGQRPPATVSRDLTRSETKNNEISDGAVNLRDTVNQQVVFTNLAVKRTDLVAFIAQRFRREGQSTSTGIPQPNIRLEDVVKRITGLRELSERDEKGIKDACERLREKALNRVIVIFGGLDWRKTPPADYHNMVRGAIEPDFWRTNRLAPDSLTGSDKRGRTVPLSGLAMSRDLDYYSIWLDEDQVNAVWPE